MNAITNAIKDIHFNIPEEILYLAFMENNQRINSIIGIDECIMNKYIRPKLLTDCTLVGGVDLEIPFNGVDLKCINADLNTYILEISKKYTGGRSIITVGNILMSSQSFNNNGYSNSGQSWYNGFNSYVSPALSTGIKAMNALSDLNIVQTSRTEVIGENTILVADPLYIGNSGIVKCTIENSKNMENINPRSYMSFATLAVIGCKAYVYNKLRVPLDKGYALGGHEISVVKEIVDSYSDAYSMYLEEMLKWKKVAFFNNNITKAAFIRNMIPFVC